MKSKTMRPIPAILLVLFVSGLAIGTAGCDIMKDKQLQSKIREELRKDREVSADKLTINVQDGVVTISGELYTREEIDRVIEIVSAIEGVVEVRNQMNLPDDFQSHNPTFLYY